MKTQIFESARRYISKDVSARTTLSLREKQLLELGAAGFSNKEIASKLYLSIDTVDTHNRNIVRKLNARNMKEAIATGIRQKIIE